MALHYEVYSLHCTLCSSCLDRWTSKWTLTYQRHQRCYTAGQSGLEIIDGLTDLINWFLNFIRRCLSEQWLALPGDFGRRRSHWNCITHFMNCWWTFRWTNVRILRTFWFVSNLLTWLDLPIASWVLGLLDWEDQRTNCTGTIYILENSILIVIRIWCITINKVFFECTVAP